MLVLWPEIGTQNLHPHASSSWDTARFLRGQHEKNSTSAECSTTKYPLGQRFCRNMAVWARLYPPSNIPCLSTSQWVQGIPKERANKVEWEKKLSATSESWQTHLQQRWLPPLANHLSVTLSLKQPFSIRVSFTLSLFCQSRSASATVWIRVNHPATRQVT